MFLSAIKFKNNKEESKRKEEIKWVKKLEQRQCNDQNINRLINKIIEKKQLWNKSVFFKRTLI